jgi:hypothetical protein
MKIQEEGDKRAGVKGAGRGVRQSSRPERRRERRDEGRARWNMAHSSAIFAGHDAPLIASKLPLAHYKFRHHWLEPGEMR